MSAMGELYWIFLDPDLLLENELEFRIVKRVVARKVF